MLGVSVFSVADQVESKLNKVEGLDTHNSGVIDMYDV